MPRQVDANSPCGAEVLQAADQKLQRVAAALPAGLLSQAVPPGLFSDQEVRPQPRVCWPRMGLVAK